MFFMRQLGFMVGSCGQEKRQVKQHLSYENGSGKIMRRKAYKNHLLERKDQDRKRKLSKMTTVHETDAKRVELMMPYL